MNRIFLTSIFFTLLILISCGEDEVNVTTEPIREKIVGAYNPIATELAIPEWLPDMEIPADNPLTEAGVELGRFLFFDPIMSIDSSISCASCHFPEQAFTDLKKVSKGVGGATGNRNAMSLVNVGFYTKGLFWDGRVNSLEDQAIIPIEDHREMNDTWENVEAKLRRHASYPEMFRAAFGVEYTDEITRDLATKALAQFERTLVSGYSRFDRIVFQNDLDAGFFTDAEERGRELFFFELSQQIEHPGCSHCHGGPLFTDNTFKNNGIDSVQTLNDFEDLGLGGVTNRTGDKGKFRVPTLRNIELTAPYMHDGRFETLEEVLEHYSSGGHFADNLDANIRPFTMTERDQQDLIAFMKMLTDTSAINNPAFRNPFVE